MQNDMSTKALRYEGGEYQEVRKIVNVHNVKLVVELQPRHLHHLQRLHHAVEIEPRRGFELAHVAVGKRLELDAELAQLPLAAGAPMAKPRRARI